MLKDQARIRNAARLSSEILDNLTGTLRRRLARGEHLRIEVDHVEFDRAIKAFYARRRGQLAGLREHLSEKRRERSGPSSRGELDLFTWFHLLCLRVVAQQGCLLQYAEFSDEEEDVRRLFSTHLISRADPEVRSRYGDQRAM